MGRGIKFQEQNAELLLKQVAQLSIGHGGRNFLYVSHLDCAAFPGGQYLLDTLAQNTVALRDPAAAPSEEEIKLHGLALQIGTIVLREGRHLRRKADPIRANLPSQFAQGEVLDTVSILDPWPNTIDGGRNRESHGIGLVCVKSYKKGMKTHERTGPKPCYSSSNWAEGGPESAGLLKR
jgi:hypothetical protein